MVDLIRPNCTSMFACDLAGGGDYLQDTLKNGLTRSLYDCDKKPAAGELASD